MRRNRGEAGSEYGRGEEERKKMVNKKDYKTEKQDEEYTWRHGNKTRNLRKSVASMWCKVLFRVFLHLLGVVDVIKSIYVLEEM